MSYEDHEDVDKVVDEVVSDPEKAAKLKEVLHKEMDKRKPAKARYSRPTQDDVDDMFDNMPV